jgi:hypothetical protein
MQTHCLSPILKGGRKNTPIHFLKPVTSSFLLQTKSGDNMSSFISRSKTSGRDPHFDQRRTGGPGPVTGNPTQNYIPPIQCITVTILNPSPEPGSINTTLLIPQYAPTVRGQWVGYDPANDCDGMFMSYKFQPNNNCYNYACDIATNTFAQPGRYHGTDIWFQLPPTVPPFFNAANVQAAAELDGLLYVGNSMAEVLAYQQPGPGHFVALLISEIGDINWSGDYHWVRCDNSSAGCDQWSQKDGNDQVTNFDFAGNPITDPSKANWTVNTGQISAGSTVASLAGGVLPLVISQEFTVAYIFHCFMFVPDDQVNIL